MGDLPTIAGWAIGMCVLYVIREWWNNRKR